RVASDVNNPGAVAVTGTGKGSLRVPRYSTCTCVLALLVPKYGVTAEICADETNTKGAGTPSNSTRTPPAAVLTIPLASRPERAAAAGPSPVPHTSIIWPGAIAVA